MKINKGKIAAITAFLLAAPSANADWQLPQNPGLPSSFDNSIINIINWFLGFITTLSVLVIIYGGIIYLTSTGNQERVTQGKKTVQYAIMGLVIAGLAYAIVILVVGNVLRGA